MPARPQPTGMTSDEFRALLEAAGLGQERAAAVLGVNKSTVHRWQHGQTSISASRAALIRERLAPVVGNEHPAPTRSES